LGVQISGVTAIPDFVFVFCRAGDDVPVERNAGAYAKVHGLDESVGRAQNTWRVQGWVGASRCVTDAPDARGASFGAWIAALVCAGLHEIFVGEKIAIVVTIVADFGLGNATRCGVAHAPPAVDAGFGAWIATLVCAGLREIFVDEKIAIVVLIVADFGLGNATRCGVAGAPSAVDAGLSTGIAARVAARA